jgi:hypothetical protein
LIIIFPIINIMLSSVLENEQILILETSYIKKAVPITRDGFQKVINTN